MDIDLDAVEYTYKRLKETNNPITPEDIAYISGRLEEFLRAHGYVHDDEVAITPRKRSLTDLIKEKLT